MFFFFFRVSPLFSPQSLSCYYCLHINVHSVSSPSQHVHSIKQSLLLHFLFHLLRFSNFHHYFSTKFTSSHDFVLISLRTQFQLSLHPSTPLIIVFTSPFISSCLYFPHFSIIVLQSLPRAINLY